MNKELEFIESEINYFGKIYSDVMFAISEITPFIDELKLKQRKYYIKSKTLKEYIKFLEAAKIQCEKKSLLSIFKPNSSINLLLDYKSKNKEDFIQLEKCSKCVCLNCSFTCNFKSCSSCRSNSLLSYCDRKKVNVREFDNFILDLTNNETGVSSKYKVLGVVEDCQLDKLYILLDNIINNNDKLVLYYYPGIKDDSFGEITNPQEFDFIVQTYQCI